MNTKTNRLAVVTGASRGIGRAIAKELLRNAYSVIGVSRNGLEADPELVQLALEKQVDYYGFQADITKKSDHQKLKEYVAAQSKALNLLVHNAGIAPKERKDVIQMSRASYDQVMETNLHGPVFLTQTLLPLMDLNVPGSIVFVTSISAVVASLNRAEYCISKAGLSMFSRLMAQRLAQTAISVYEIRPGIIETDMTLPVLEKYQTMIQSGLVPKGRMGQPEDVAKVVRALVSGDFAYASGSCIEVSGGMQIRSL